MIQRRTNGMRDDTELVAIVERSGVARFIERIVTTLRGAARGSALLGTVDAARQSWVSQSVRVRTRYSGIALISASTVHVALMLWQGGPLGWMWLIVPTVVGLLGGLMALAPGRGEVPERHL